MKKQFILILGLLCLGSITKVQAQFDEDKMGAWYMYFFDHQLNNSKFGFQGDIQYRNWNLAGDLEQLLLRAGMTYRPANTNVKLTLGYGHITSGAFGDSDDTSTESRIYQEAIVPSKIGNRLFFKHRFRYEQRFVEDQDFRTRYRYNLFLNIPINAKVFEKKTIYAALYNELFINGQKDIGDGRRVETFDRNRFYSGIGYVIKKGLNVQFGYMNQQTNSRKKNQWQFSLHHNF